MVTMTAMKHSAIPRFQFHLSYRHLNNGLITVGDEVIHRIKDIDNFYNALGYTDEIRNTGLSFDEFIWFEYRKDHCSKSEACLQAKIIEYLIKFSATFMKKYADQYESWLGSCLDEMSPDSPDCIHCVMHPNQCEQEFFNCMTSSEVTFYITKI
jgi:hypothetical protein